MNPIRILAIMLLLMTLSISWLPAQQTESVELLGKYPVEQSREDSGFIQPGLVITTNEQFNQIWKKLKGGDQPKISFETSFIVLHVRDAANPNRHRFSARVKDGELEVLALSTRIGFQRSDKTLTTILEVSRDGISAVRAYNPKTKKHITTAL